MRKIYGCAVITLYNYTGEAESIHQQEHKKYGGARLTTFMVYLSNVESGGHTVFPTIDLYVKPRLFIH